MSGYQVIVLKTSSNNSLIIDPHYEIQVLMYYIMKAYSIMHYSTYGQKMPNEARDAQTRITVQLA